MLPQLLCALALLLPAAATAAGEGDVVRVRARSELDLAEGERSVRTGGRLSDVQIRLVLRDAATGAPLGGQPLHLLLAGSAPVRLRTDEDGEATGVLLGLRPGRYQVVGRYGGDALRDPAAATLELDLTRRAVRLGLDAPAQAPLLGDLPLAVELRDGETPLPGPVGLRVGGVLVPLTLRGGRGAAVLRLDPGGRPPLPGLRGGALLPVEATFSGDEFHAPTRARRQVLLMTQAQVALDPLPRGEVAQGSALLVTGTARDQEGPLAGEPVELIAVPEGGGERVLGRAQVDGAGRFAVQVRRLSLGLGPAALVAEVVPTRSHRQRARSAPLAVQVLPPEPAPLGYFLAPAGATALVLLASLALRRRAWLAAALAHLRRRAQTGGAEPPQAGEAPRPGVTLAARSRVQALLGRPDFSIAGQVLDAAFGGPVAAEVLVGGAAPERCDAQGRFALPLLPPGRHEIEVRAAGYLSERFLAQLPHRGELRAVQVALLPIRARIMDAWRRAAEPLLPSPSEAATWTPREVLGHVRARARGVPLPPLVRLTDLVEEAYYSGRLPDVGMLLEAEALCAQVAAAPAQAAQ